MIIRRYEILHKETWGWLFRFDTGKFWLPTHFFEVRPRGLFIPKWLARARGIIREAT